MLRRRSVVTLSFSSTSRNVFSRRALCLSVNLLAATALIILFWPGVAFAQSSSEDAPPPIVAPVPPSADRPVFWPQPQSNSDEQSRSNGVSTSRDAGSLGSVAEPKQSKRILWIFPNYRAVSADTQLPPLSLKTKFWLATQDSFDYSSFITAGMLAGISQAKSSYAEFGQGAKGYRPLLLARRGGPGDWKLSHGSYRAHGNARRSAVLHAWAWRFSQAHRLRGKPFARHADRFRRPGIQYFGNRGREGGRCRNI